MKKIALTIALSIISAFCFAQNKFSVTVSVEGITQRTGTLYAALTNDAANFPKAPLAQRAVAEVTKEGEIVVTFDDVEAGKYAIILFQDLNGNKALDDNGMMPTEPVGFSNVSSLTGPPNFDESAFEVKENKSIKVSLITF